jgi:hypothetical protein
MSILHDTTEPAALALLAHALPFFEGLAGLHMNKDDAFEARKAENLIRGILETNDYPTGDLT